MSAPTAGELALLRTQPHRTKFYLSIYKPDTVLACQVNDAGAAKNDRVITYNNVTAGAFGDIERGMTMRVGSTVGGQELGTIYVKSATANTITVGENSHINWADDQYLTVIDFFQIWPLYPRYVQDDINVTIFKDYDVAYTNQNTQLGALICMGPHHAGLLDDGSHDVYYDASDTVHVKGSAMTYAWEFEGGAPASSAVVTPGNVTYSTPGHYSTRLTVTSGGVAETSTRHISIYDRPEEGTDVSILTWGFESELAGDRDAGGYSVRLFVEEDVSDIQDGALVVIFADDWYGITKQSIGGNAPNRESTIFVGYIIGDTIEFDYQDSSVSFTVSSPSELMKEVEAFSVSIEDSLNPVNDAAVKGFDPWMYVTNLSMEVALYHYIRWHTTVNLCNDVEYDATDFNLQFFDADRESLFSAMRTLMESAVVGRAVCDRQGKLWFEIEYEAIDDAATNVPTNMFIDKHDWIDDLKIQERVVNRFSSLEMGGIYWQGAAANTFSAIIAVAPGLVPAYRGSPVRLSGLALSGQAQANTMVGNVFASRNAQFPSVGIEMVGNYRNFDIAPQEKITITTESSDTFRQLTWTGKPFAVRRVSFRMNQAQSFMNARIGTAEIVQGFDADAIAVPEVPPGSEGGTTGSGFSTTEIAIPPLPVFPTIEIPAIQPIPGYVISTDSIYGLANKENITLAGHINFSGSDYEFNQGLTEGSGGFIIKTAGIYRVDWYLHGENYTAFPVLSVNLEYTPFGGGLVARNAVNAPFVDATTNDNDILGSYFYDCSAGDLFGIFIVTVGDAISTRVRLLLQRIG